MSDLRVIGIDPGPVPGIVLLDFDGPRLERAEVLQCTHGLAAELVDLLLLGWTERALVQTERFVSGRRAARSSTAGAGQITRDLVGQIQGVVALISRSDRVRPADAHLYERNAGQVKPWATDARLEAAGLLELCKGMRHARDGARHALYCAVHDGGVPDPLSKDWAR